MYTEGAQTTGYHRFLQHSNAPTPCACQNCVHYEQLYGHDRGLGYEVASARQKDQDARRDVPAPRGKDVGGIALVANRVGPSGHRSPQRRPVFAGLGHYNQTEDLSQVCPWELNPAQWSYPLKSGVRHYPSVREQCGCVVRSDTRAQPFNALVPHPLPHLQVRGQGYRHRRTIRYVTVDEEEEGCGCSSEPHSPPLPVPNGHSGPRPAFSEQGGGRDNHQDWARQKGGSEEDCNGQTGSHKCFFPTEVPQKHLNQSRRRGPRVPTSDITSPRSSITTTINSHQCQASETVRQKRRQDSVRDQIRQVVTDLEDVLGGLKQVHMEMKEVGGPVVMHVCAYMYSTWRRRITSQLLSSSAVKRLTQGSDDDNKNHRADQTDTHPVFESAHESIVVRVSAGWLYCFMTHSSSLTEVVIENNFHWPFHRTLQKLAAFRPSH